MTPRFPKFLAASAVTLALVALVLSCDRRGKDSDPNNGAPTTQKADEGGDKGQVTLSEEAIKRYGITLAPARMQVLIATFDAPARITFDQTTLVQVTSIVPGRIVDLRAQLGQQVKKGEQLAVIESTELGTAQSDYLQKRIAASSAKIAIEPLKAAWERATSLYQQSQGVSLAEVQKREADYKAAQAAARTADAAVRAAASQLRLLGMNDAEIDKLGDSGQIEPRHVVLAPQSGQIIARNVTLGQIVSPDKDTLFTIADLTRLWALVDVPEARLKDVAIGSEARVTGSGVAAQGKVALISPAIDPTTQTAQVRIEIENPPSAIRPGMFATAHLTDASAKPGAPVLAVPQDAVQMIDGQPVVFVADDKPNTFARREVAVGPAIGDMVPVLSGLREGEKVVSSGSFILKADLGKSAE